MKYLAFFLLSVSLSAADFYTGQAARLVIGQPNFAAQQPGTSQFLVGAASGLAFANDMLFVADSNRLGAAPDNHRVLIYKNVSGKLPGPYEEIPVWTARCPICTGTADVVLGQPDFEKNTMTIGSQNGMRLPTAVATDGQRLAVADTDNNRVLLWNSIPSTNGANADLVVGQSGFTNRDMLAPRPPNNKSMRGPQGVWILNGKLYVADTQNHRVLIWNSFPTQNGQAADIVLGQPDFNSFVEPDLTRAAVDAKAENMLNPVSVTSDGTRLFVTDLGHNRVLIWNSIPTRNQQPADVVVGQPDMNGAAANNSPKLCPSNGTDTEGKETFPQRCLATLEFPRFSLSDGKRLFIADGGNDRVLMYNNIPQTNGYTADVVLGQLGGEVNQVSDSAEPLLVASSGTLRTPMSLAWDGTNLYASDPFNRRIMVFTPGDTRLLPTAVRNAASREIFAVGSITFSGEVKENDEITIKIADKEYKYKIVKDDSFGRVITTLVNLINEGAGDSNVFATPNPTINGMVLTARASGEAGNQVSYSTTTSTGAVIIATTGGAVLAGGQDAAKIAPGTLVTILGDNFTDRSASAPADVDRLPTELAGVQVYFDGNVAPLMSVAPNQIIAQVPFEVLDTNSINAYVRSRFSDGRLTVSSAIAVPIIPQNPGIFALDGTDPRPGVVLHYSSHATGTVSVDGSAKAGDIAGIKIEERVYNYTVKEGDTLESIRDGLIGLINDNPDERVVAFPAGVFTRVRLRAKLPGPEGNNIVYGSSVAEGAQVILTGTTPKLCCANVAGAPVNEQNPALPGETIIIYATGLGLVKPDEARLAIATGEKYKGPELNEPVEFVSSLAGGKTANVLYAALKPGAVGLYEVHLELNSDLPTNPQTQLTIAQFLYVSNIVSFALNNPLPPATP